MKEPARIESPMPKAVRKGEKQSRRAQVFGVQVFMRLHRDDARPCGGLASYLQNARTFLSFLSPEDEGRPSESLSTEAAYRLYRGKRPG